MVIFSKDNGLTWDTREMGQDAGTPNPRKNTEVSTDTESMHITFGLVVISESIFRGQQIQEIHGIQNLLE